MRILQLIVSGTLANAGRPERVKNKKQKNLLPSSSTLIAMSISQLHYAYVIVYCIVQICNCYTAELFGPGYFVRLGLELRLKYEIRTRTRTRT
jgi:hypothetical protein